MATLCWGQNRKQRGFTSLDLACTVAAVSVLCLIVVLSLGRIRAGHRDARRLADIKQIQAALKLYYNEKGAFPVAAAPGILLGQEQTKVFSSGGFQSQAAPADTVFLLQVPRNFITPVTIGYRYYSPDGTDYLLEFELEKDLSPYKAGIYRFNSTQL